jgi:hypothetical protein
MKRNAASLFIVICLAILVAFVALSWSYLGSVLPPDKPEKLSALIAYAYTLITLATLLAVIGGALLAFRQLAHLNASIKTNTVQLMTTAHRELLNKALDSRSIFNALKANELPNGESEHLVVYLSMVFNHGFNAFTLHEQKYIDEEWWTAIRKDMRNTMHAGAMRQWWTKTREYYPKRYQEFIDGQISQQS